MKSSFLTSTRSSRNSLGNTATGIIDSPLSLLNGAFSSSSFCFSLLNLNHKIPPKPSYWLLWPPSFRQAVLAGLMDRKRFLWREFMMFWVGDAGLFRNKEMKLSIGIGGLPEEVGEVLILLWMIMLSIYLGLLSLRSFLFCLLDPAGWFSHSLSILQATWGLFA